MSTATPLRSALRLTPGAAAALRRGKQLSLHLTVRFTPTTGAPVVHNQVLTLVSAACTPPRPGPPPKGRPVRIPASCPTRG